MKKQLSAITKGMLITGISFLLISPVKAQKEKNKSLITQEQINKINEIVKPLKDQFDKQLNGDKTYAAYKEDVRKITAAKSIEEKRALTAKLDGKYLDFFKKLWAAAKVDEKYYQDKIRGVFSSDIATLLQFSFFLNFSIALSTADTEPPPPEVPVDICLDICPIAVGDMHTDAWLISGGPVSYGNCYVKSKAWAAAAGLNLSDGYLRNGITIPGTLPEDDRKLRVRKHYELKQEATSFAVVGGGFSSTVLTTYKAYEVLAVFAPVVWMHHAVTTKTMNEDYTLQKRDVAKSMFDAYAVAGSAVVSGSWSSIECTSIKWKICEEK